MRRRIHLCHMRRRIHVCHMRRRIPVRPNERGCVVRLSINTLATPTTSTMLSHHHTRCHISVTSSYTVSHQCHIIVCPLSRLPPPPCCPVLRLGFRLRV
jgi:hypothetical protein